jgi:UrcA family protein
MVAAVAVSGFLLVPTLAHARQIDNSEWEQVSATVRYNSADLQTPEGAQRFQRRVDSAIRTMCSRGRENMPSMISDTRRCIADARQAAEPNVQLALAQ